MAMNWVNNLQGVAGATMALHATVNEKWRDAEGLEKQAAELALRAQSLRAKAYHEALAVESALRHQFGDSAVDAAKRTVTPVTAH